MLSILFLLFGYGNEERVLSTAVENVIDKALQSPVKVMRIGPNSPRKYIELVIFRLPANLSVSKNDLIKYIDSKFGDKIKIDSVSVFPDYYREGVINYQIEISDI